MEPAPRKVTVLAETTHEIVGLIEFKGQIILATKRGVYRLVGDVFEPIRIMDDEGNV